MHFEHRKGQKMEWSFFFRQLEVGMSIDETCFYFSDDPTEEEHYLPEYGEAVLGEIL